MSARADSDTVDFVPSLKGTHRPLPQSELVDVELAGLSHTGLVRLNNEDHFLTCRFNRGLEILGGTLPSLPQGKRFHECGYGMAVADGMGGQAAGEVASGMAIESLVNLVLHTPDWIFRMDDDWESAEMLRRGTERFEEIGQTLSDEATRNPALRGFGTTLTVVWSLGHALHFAHVGDSRAYLFREGKLERLTSDHTLAQQLADRRAISQKDVVTHRLRHVLTRCLGDHNDAMSPEVGRYDLRDGDKVLLCTDGLTDMLSESKIAELLNSDLPTEESCRRLIESTLEAGGKDNVTAIVARYRMPAEAME
jgi:protein phosphatase